MFKIVELYRTRYMFVDCESKVFFSGRKITHSQILHHICLTVYFAHAQILTRYVRWTIMMVVSKAFMCSFIFQFGQFQHVFLPLEKNIKIDMKYLYEITCICVFLKVRLKHVVFLLLNDCPKRMFIYRILIILKQRASKNASYTNTLRNYM